MAEQLICNQQVVGSTPITSLTQKELREINRTEYGGIPEWPKGTDCKSAGTAFGGSNPPSPSSKQNAESEGFGFLFCIGGWLYEKHRAGTHENERIGNTVPFLRN